MERLNREQLEYINRQAGPMMRKLHAIRRRLERRNYHPGDELFDAVVRAHDAIHSLSVRSHYLTCDGGVGHLQGRPDPLAPKGPAAQEEAPSGEAEGVKA